MIMANAISGGGDIGNFSSNTHNNDCSFPQTITAIKKEPIDAVRDQKDPVDLLESPPEKIKKKKEKVKLFESPPEKTKPYTYPTSTLTCTSG